MWIKAQGDEPNARIEVPNQSLEIRTVDGRNRIQEPIHGGIRCRGYDVLSWYVANLGVGIHFDEGRCTLEIGLAVRRGNGSLGQIDRASSRTASDRKADTQAENDPEVVPATTEPLSPTSCVTLQLERAAAWRRGRRGRSVGS